MAQPLEQIRAEDVRTVDFRFTDLRGQWQHIRVAAGAVDEALLEHVMFDGSALAGWRDVSQSDMLLKPDLASAVLDPFSAQANLILICNVAEPTTALGYERCPRSVAEQAEAHLAVNAALRAHPGRAPGRILRVRRRAFRDRRQRGVLPGRFRGRAVQLGHPL